MTIRIYELPAVDGEVFTIRAVLPRIAKASFNEHISRAGTFSFEIPSEAVGASELRRGGFAVLDGYYCGFIDSVIRWNDASGSWVRASGFHALGLLAQRIIVPPDLSEVSAMAGYDDRNGATEDIIKGYINANLAAPAVTARKWPGVRTAPSRRLGIPEDKYSTRYNLLSDTVQELCDGAGIGVSATANIDTGEILFDCYDGADRTWGNPDTSPVVADIARGNVISMRLTESDENLRNVFYTTMGGAEFADEALTLTYWRNQDTDDIPAGTFRREIHQEISVNTPTAGDEYNELRRQATSQMAQHESAYCIECEVDAEKLRYRRDFFLADRLTIRNAEWKVTTDAQVTGVETTVDGGSRTCKLTFGKNVPGPLMTLRRDIKRGGM